MSDELLMMYWLPNCTTCRSAARYLEKSGYTVSEFRDIKSAPLRRKEVESLVELVGGVDELFSRRARKYRELNLSERELTSDEMIKLMAEEYTFIRRPVLVSRGRAIAGFTPKSYDEFFRK